MTVPAANLLFRTIHLRLLLVILGVLVAFGVPFSTVEAAAPAAPPAQAGCTIEGQLTWIAPTDGPAITVYFEVGANPFRGFSTPLGRLVVSPTVTMWGFCLDALLDVEDAVYCYESDITDWRIAYVMTKYPPQPDDRIAQAAHQAAVWHYTNNINVNPTNPTDSNDPAEDAAVLAIYNAILAEVDGFGENQPGIFADGDVTIDITPATDTNQLPLQAAHPFTVTLTKGGQPLIGYTVDVSTTLGTLNAASGTTGVNGQAVFTVTSSSVGTAQLGASATVALPSAMRFIDKDLPTEPQPLGVSDPEIVTVSDTASKEWVGPPGNLTITKSVISGTLTIPTGQTFNICVTGPAPATPDCKVFTYPNDLVQTWTDLPAGEYTISEPTASPFQDWQFVVVDSNGTVQVPAGGTATATVRNSAIQPDIKLEALCAKQPATAREWKATNDSQNSYQCVAQVVGGTQQQVQFTLGALSSVTFTTFTVADGDNQQNGVVLRCDGVVVDQKDSDGTTCNVSGQGSSRVGDRIWFDGNCNGLQDPGEINYTSPISVTLYRNSFTPVNQVATQRAVFGYYQFSDLPAGRYCVQFGPLAGRPISPINQGPDRDRDSDVDPTTGQTACFDLAESTADLDWDLGICQSPFGLEPEEEPGAVHLLFLGGLRK